MTITKSTRYALYAAAEMAAAESAPVTVAGVAARYGIPESALAKVFQQLVRSGLAVGTRGIGGGYRLSRPPAAVTVLDVLHVFERPRTPGACLLHDDPGQACPQHSACSLQWLFEEVDELVRCTYESVTLETLVRRAGQGPAIAVPVAVRPPRTRTTAAAFPGPQRPRRRQKSAYR